MLQAQADLAAAAANVDVAAATLQKAHVYVEFTKIRSHYNGVVTARNFHDGDYIRSAGQIDLPLFVVQRTDKMRVIVQIPDIDVPFCRTGDPADFTISTLPQVKFPVYQVSRISASQDQKSRTMRVEVDVPNDNGILRDGMYGDVTVHFKTFTGERKAASNATVRIPSSAVRRDRDKMIAYVVRDQIIHPVAVEIGTDNGNVAEILAGLSSQDEVVNNPGPELHDGLAVRVVTDGKAPAQVAAH